MKIIKDDVILGDYEIIASTGDDAAFQWVSAHSRRDNKPVLLQILRPETPWRKEVLANWINYFDALSGVSRRSLHLPSQVLSDSRYPLIVVYPALNGEILEDALKKRPAEETAWWHQASEAINVLHNRGLVHGGIAPQSLMVVDGDVVLTRFGYGPLASADPRMARDILKEYLAPEVANGSLTKASDIYSFAQTVAHWRPDLRSTSWCSQAAHTEPSQRFRNMRDVYAGLERALSTVPAKAEIPVVNEGSRIVPKFALTVTAEPPEGGQINGGGRYLAGETIKISAEPSPGWEFTVWSEDLRGDQNPIDLVVDANKVVIGHFTRSRRPQFTIRMSTEPAEAGEVLGGGRYFSGERKWVEAKAAEGWIFKGWEGDLIGPAERALLMINSDKSIIATFQKIADPILSVKAEPPEGGTVLGGGPHTCGENVTVRAVPAPLWRFIRWTGDYYGTRNPMTIQPTDDQIVIAHFGKTIWEEVDLIAVVQPEQGGTIVGVTVGNGKQQKGQSVRIAANPNPGWRFTGWAGDVQGTEPHITLEMNANKLISAHFELEKPPAKPRGGAFQTPTETPSSSGEAEPQRQAGRTRTSIPGWAFGGNKESADAGKAEVVEKAELKSPPVTSSPPETPSVKPQNAEAPKSPKRLLGDAFRVKKDGE